MTKVKICGLTSADVVREMNPWPIDYIGFIFAKSRREIAPQQAAELNRFKPKQAETVGVFVDPDIGEIERVFQHVKLDVVQLHGKEKAAFCREVRRRFACRVSKTVHMSRVGTNGADEENGFKALDAYAPYIDMLLLDTVDQGVSGGTGKRFDWETIPRFRRWCEKHRLPLMVAGGIDADNVRGLIAAHRPDAVDVSSGVETDGAKDPQKIKRFVERVKARECRT